MRHELQGVSSFPTFEVKSATKFWPQPKVKFKETFSITFAAVIGVIFRCRILLSSRITLPGRRKWRSVLSQLVSWCLYELPKQVKYNKNDDSITRCSKVSIHSICTSVLLHYVVVTPIRESGHKAAKLSLDLLTWMTSPPRRGTSSASSERTVADSASSRSRFRPRDLGRSTTGRSERIPGLWSGPEQSLLVSLAWCSRPRCSPRCRNPLPFPEKFSPWNRSSTAFKDEIGFWERLKFRLNHVYNVRSRSNFCSSFEIYNLGISKNKNV